MSTSVLTKEFERLAERNAQLLYTEEGAGDTLVESKEKSDEFEANLSRLTEIKALLEKEGEFNALQQWAKTPQRKAAAFATNNGQEAEEQEKVRGRMARARDVLQSEEFTAYLARIVPQGVGPNADISDNTPVGSPKFQLDGRLLPPAKNTLVTGGSSSGGAFFQIDYQNDLYVPFIQPGLTVRDLVQNRRTDADVISFPRAVTHANAAAEVAEATTAADAVGTADTGTGAITYDTTGMGLKPEGAFTWEIVTQAVGPIAEGVPISKRSLMNASELEDIIDQQLRYDIEQRLNTQMISGNGSAPNLRGIRNTSGILTQAFSNNVIETIRKAKTKVTDTSTGSGKIPNGAVLTPASMETLDLFRVGGSTTTDGPFLVNPFGSGVQSLWGMALVTDPGMTANKAVVGYFRDAVLWDRQVATVEVFEQHKDYAARNLVFLLGEWWGTFGVLQPKSFVDATMS